MQSSKEKFFKSKLAEITQTTIAEKTLVELLNELRTISIKGFKISEQTQDGHYHRDFICEITILNDFNDGCRISFHETKSGFMYGCIYYIFDGRQWFYKNYESGACKDIYKYLAQIESIKKGYKEFCNKLDKENRILDISKNSVQIWLENALKDSGYIYYTQRKKNQDSLHILLDKKRKLIISIYYKKFQQIIPYLLDIIKNYENIINNCPIKALIENYGLKTSEERGKIYDVPSLYEQSLKKQELNVFERLEMIKTMDNILKDTHYYYYYEERTNQITLNVLLNNRIKLI
jgi:hypothetical protein